MSSELINVTTKFHTNGSVVKIYVFLCMVMQLVIISLYGYCYILFQNQG
jgi:hypothetical protein